jgi:hypothetical protein
MKQASSHSFDWRRHAATLVVWPLLLSVTAAAAPERHDEIRCSYAHQVACSDTGCEPIPIGDRYLIVPSIAELRSARISHYGSRPPVVIHRCDSNGCTPVEATSAPSGVFLNVSAIGGGYILKLFDSAPVYALDYKPGEFVEVATSFLTTFISYGRCTFPGGD